MRNPGFLHQLASRAPQSYPSSMLQPSSSSSTPSSAPAIAPVKHKHISMSHYESIRKEFHRHPELSGQEKNTAARIAKLLLAIGLPASAIHTGIGGHGIAAVIPNGAGKTILLRSDTDGLPVKEQTGFSFASTDTQVDEDGEEKPTMHACGHDTHITCLLAAAETLMKTKDEWSGTVILVFQPAEERLGGASRMVKDGLYKRVPIPDVLLGQHVFPERAGTVNTRPGALLAASDSMKITFFGRGSHASQPQNSIDPIVMAASAVLRLQTIVSREVPPVETAVVTVSAIHGGAAENVIGGDCYIRVNVRTYKAEVREKITGAIRRIVDAEASASGATKTPEILTTTSGPATYNDPEATAVISEVFEKKFGERFDGAREPVMGSEDFGDLATSIGKPSVFWFFGGTDQKTYDDAKRRGKLEQEIPSNHSPFFGPAMQPTLETGIDAMVTAAMAFVGKK